jgi:tetratricopeptide (TPR) repeat protein
MLAHAFEIRLELRPVLNLLGEVRPALERVREAAALADRLNDDRLRGETCAIVTNLHSLLGEMDEALVTGTRGLEIADQRGDVRLRVLATTYLGQAHYFRGDYERVVELASSNLALLPDDSTYEHFGATVPPAVYDRCWLVLSLAQLGRFAEAERHGREAIRIAEETQHANTTGLAYRSTGMLHLVKGDWERARTLSDHGFRMFRAANVVIQLPSALAASAWARAQLGEANEALEHIRLCEETADALASTGIVGHLAWSYHALGHAALVLGRLDEARRLADRATAFVPHHTGFLAHAERLLGDITADQDPDRAEGHYREALALAESRGMRPLVAHCHRGLGALYSRMGKRDPARGHLATAASMYRQLGMSFGLAKASTGSRPEREPSADSPK